jgi:GT2 family glycosyltransferase
MENPAHLVSVAVVIVTWNSSHLIDRVLGCLTKQSVRPQQVLVIDNASDDIDSLRAALSKYPEYTLHSLKTNLGFAAANNLAARLAHPSEFIALLNPDAFANETWLEKLLVAANKYPDDAAFGSRLLKAANPDFLDGAGDYLSLSGKPGRLGHGKLAARRFESPVPIFSPCAAAALYRRAPFEQIQGFDESFFCYVEDVDLAFRLLLKGHGAKYVPDSVVLHMGSALTGIRSKFSVYYGQRNIVLNYVKNMPMPLFWALLLPHLMMNLAFLLAAMFTGHGPQVWAAKRDAYRLLPQVLIQRRQIQATRISSSLRVVKLLRWTLW